MWVLKGVGGESTVEGVGEECGFEKVLGKNVGFKRCWGKKVFNISVNQILVFEKVLGEESIEYFSKPNPRV